VLEKLQLIENKIRALKAKIALLEKENSTLKKSNQEYVKKIDDLNRQLEEIKVQHSIDDLTKMTKSRMTALISNKHLLNDFIQLIESYIAEIEKKELLG
jgi:hypothetical protein